MRRSHFEAFAPVCPVCAAMGRTPKRLIVAVELEATSEAVESGILHCPDPGCMREYPIIDGIPIIVPELRRLLAERGVEALTRVDVDPVMESLLGDGFGPDSWFNATRQILSTYGWDAYADLDPEEEAIPQSPRPGAARDCLGRLLTLAGPAKPAGRVVDLGCAAGRTSFELSERYPDALVLGIDINLAILRLAQRAAKGFVSYPRRRIGMVYDRRDFPVPFETNDRVDFWACDALALPFDAHRIDLIAALNVLDCVPEPQRLLTSLARLLADGGRLLLATPYDWATRATPVESWIGGHSQRADHRGAGEIFLRSLLTGGSHAQSVPDLSILGEAGNWPWHTRLHDRGSVQYLTHLLALEKRGPSQ